MAWTCAPVISILVILLWWFNSQSLLIVPSSQSWGLRPHGKAGDLVERGQPINERPQVWAAASIRSDMSKRAWGGHWGITYSSGLASCWPCTVPPGSLKMCSVLTSITKLACVKIVTIFFKPYGVLGISFLHPFPMNWYNFLVFYISHFFMQHELIFTCLRNYSDSWLPWTFICLFSSSLLARELSTRLI